MVLSNTDLMTAFGTSIDTPVGSKRAGVIFGAEYGCIAVTQQRSIVVKNQGTILSAINRLRFTAKAG